MWCSRHWRFSTIQRCQPLPMNGQRLWKTKFARALGILSVALRIFMQSNMPLATQLRDLPCEPPSSLNLNEVPVSPLSARAHFAADRKMVKSSLLSWGLGALVTTSLQYGWFSETCPSYFTPTLITNVTMCVQPEDPGYSINTHITASFASAPCPESSTQSCAHVFFEVHGGHRLPGTNQKRSSSPCV